MLCDVRDCAQITKLCILGRKMIKAFFKAGPTKKIIYKSQLISVSAPYTLLVCLTVYEWHILPQLSLSTLFIELFCQFDCGFNPLLIFRADSLNT